MPHLTVEYTDNLGDDARMMELLRTLSVVLRERGDIYPVGGLRARAVRLSEYVIADGQEDDAFVHVTLRVAAGRSPEVRRETGAALFEALKAHYADAFARRYLALSLDVQEFGEGGTFKHNNIHARFKKVTS
ncbi:5-carboxymethyl-2-hydroxymuconate isomerase [Deinococcus metalli]|uniref:5-carboxymethyl-2-hydroxymuconate isomerase n=1 Tax=Deinococcus metalli TaxID=1141878 RepID=A0A7W8NQJ1_9DEIO|nr:5-carboxymethyl-2-hydroxymuconate Delta-isomerase [Deinococcus metalli]MBB5377946.1 5-carboxymethyl-2-hydroxymuconate isomerase [Deinococcus metalli]GHF54935.1 5-carboxymethyl-2-hydroxymuconate isomerase [Deinococcus metalli]